MPLVCSGDVACAPVPTQNSVCCAQSEGGADCAWHSAWLPGWLPLCRHSECRHCMYGEDGGAAHAQVLLSIRVRVSIVCVCVCVCVCVWLRARVCACAYVCVGRDEMSCATELKVADAYTPASTLANPTYCVAWLCPLPEHAVSLPCANCYQLAS